MGAKFGPVYQDLDPDPDLALDQNPDQDPDPDLALDPDPDLALALDPHLDLDLENFCLIDRFISYYTQIV